jgi:hypothetical protein
MPANALVDTSGMDVVYSDSFDNAANWNIGGGWQIVDSVESPNDWGTGNIAYINSGNGKYNKPQVLKTVSNINLSEYKTVILQFDTNISFRGKPDNQRVYVIVTNETGSQFYVWSKNKARYDGTVQIDISRLVAGNKSVNLTFQYQNNKRSAVSWWEVDNVAIFGNESGAVTYGKIHLEYPAYTVQENGGPLTVNVIREGDSTGTATVFYTTDNDNTISNFAMPGVNYGVSSVAEEVTGTLTFDTGVTTQQIVIPILSDGVVTPDLLFNVSIDSPTGNVILTDPTIAEVTIKETDTGSTHAVLQLSSPTYIVAEDGVSVMLDVTRTVNTAGIVTVEYSTVDGTALAGTNFGTAGDVSEVSGTLTFIDGDATETITIPILVDGVYMPDLSFTVELSGNSSNAYLGTPSTAAVTITNVDPYMLYLKQGWNLVSFPVVNTTLMASDLAGTGVLIVASYNMVTGDYDAYNTVSSPPEYDISMSTDVGYFVYCTMDTSVVVYGSYPSGRSATINPGWNMIGWSSFTSSTAKAVCNQPSLSDMQIIAKYNATTGDYDAFAEVASPDEYDFSMHDGLGYFVYTVSVEPQTLYYEVL